MLQDVKRTRSSLVMLCEGALLEFPCKNNDFLLVQLVKLLPLLGYLQCCHTSKLSDVCRHVHMHVRRHVCCSFGAVTRVQTHIYRQWMRRVGGWLAGLRTISPCLLRGTTRSMPFGNGSEWFTRSVIAAS